MARDVNGTRILTGQEVKNVETGDHGIVKKTTHTNFTEVSFFSCEYSKWVRSEKLQVVPTTMKPTFTARNDRPE